MASLSGIKMDLRAGAMVVSELGVPAYLNRNKFKLGGIAAGLGVSAYSANNARKNGLGVGNSLGVAGGIIGAGLSARGLGIRSALSAAGREKMYPKIDNALNKINGFSGFRFREKVWQWAYF